MHSKEKLLPLLRFESSSSYIKNLEVLYTDTGYYLPLHLCLLMKITDRAYTLKLGKKFCEYKCQKLHEKIEFPNEIYQTLVRDVLWNSVLDISLVEIFIDTRLNLSSNLTLIRKVRLRFLRNKQLVIN